MDVKDEDAGTFVLLIWYSSKTAGYVKWDAHPVAGYVPTGSAR